MNCAAFIIFIITNKCTIDIIKVYITTMYNIHNVYCIDYTLLWYILLWYQLCIC